MITWGFSWRLMGLAFMIDFEQHGFSLCVGPLHLFLVLSPNGHPKEYYEDE
jgi:hypothetical protein